MSNHDARTAGKTIVSEAIRALHREHYEESS